MSTPSAFDLESMYEAAGIDLYSLRAVMLTVANIPVSSYLDVNDDLFFGADHKTRYAQGAVGEASAHLTLHQGVLQSVPVELIDRVLEGWEPEPATIDRVHVFDAPEFYCVVAKLRDSENIRDGHDRLRLLPHIDCFAEHTPHITLAYVKRSADITRWTTALASLAGQSFEVTGRYSSL